MTPTREVLKDENGFQRNKLSVKFGGVIYAVERCGVWVDWTDLRGDLSVLVNSMTGQWPDWDKYTGDEGGY